MKKAGSIIFLILFTISCSAWSQEESEDEYNDQSAQQEVKERKYVTDKLRLSLYKKADSNSGTLKLLISGDVLDILQRSGPYSKVRTADGETGWVKNGFLSSTPTASFLLIEEEKKNEQLVDRLDKFSNTQKIVDDYENTIKKMDTDNQTNQQELNTIRQELEKVNELNIELQEELDAYTRDSSRLSLKELYVIVVNYWYVITGILLVIFILGFVMGKQLVEAQIRKRFQGVQVL